MSTTLVELIAVGIFLVCILDGVHKGLLLKVFFAFADGCGACPYDDFGAGSKTAVCGKF